jgi:hypothetical protein
MNTPLPEVFVPDMTPEPFEFIWNEYFSSLYMIDVSLA